MTTLYGRRASPFSGTARSQISRFGRTMDETKDQVSLSHSFTWRDDYALGHQTMDETHHEFVKCVQTLLTTEDHHLANALEAFADHAYRHFSEEDAAMRETAYESAGCHIDEHAAVLRSLDEVRALLTQGQTEVVRSFARALADWFAEHVRVMDQGLARWLIQRQLGAAPVVIWRRQIAA
jgi:hemerythrin